MREKIDRLFIGRNGIDQLNIALLIAAVDLLFPMVSRYAMQELLPHNSYLTLC